MRNFYLLGILCLMSLLSLPAQGQLWEIKQTLPAVASSNMVANQDFAFLPMPDAGNGLVQVYRRVNNAWVSQTPITISAFPVQGFGVSISLDGDNLAICSINIVRYMFFNTFDIHIFKREQDSWVLTQTINYTNSGNDNSCPSVYNGFANSVSMKHGILFFSCYDHCTDTTYNSVVYAYKKNTNGVWSFFKKFKHDYYFLQPFFPPPLNHVKIYGNWLMLSNKSSSVADKGSISMYDINDCINSPNIFFTTPASTMLGKTVQKMFQTNSSQSLFALDSINQNQAMIYSSYRLKNNIWTKVQTLSNDQANSLSTPEHTDNVLLMRKYVGPNHDKKARVIQTYKRVNDLWVKDNDITIPGVDGTINILSMSILDDDNFLAVVETNLNNTKTYQLHHFRKTKGNLIKGNIYHDANMNCLKDIGEVGKSYYLVKAEPNGYMAATDENGDYELSVGSGTYILSQVIPQSNALNVTQNCPTNSGTYTVNFNGLNQEVSGYDFANKVKECDLLKVDVVTRRRRCFRNQTIIYYQNEGYANANNAYVKVKFPEYVIPLSSTIPWISQADNTYTFDLGTLQAGQYGNFVVTDSVACVAGITGIMQCTEAKIYPKNTCALPNWNGASLDIVGTCMNAVPHKARFLIKNNGTANMTELRNYKIWANNVIILQNNLLLSQGDSLVLEIPTNGANIFIQAEQVAGHPDGLNVSAAVLNCGNTLPNSPNIVQAPLVLIPNDEYANVETDCRTITDSYDPNDKTVSPAGITENNYVKPHTELEYLIRFQNMGTAEAVNIVVVDTISNYLDLGTLQMMRTSHSCKFKIENTNNKRTLVWTFKDINLPAKSENEPLSHGFIKFKIKHLPTIAEGTIIKNFADIYFDFNEAIRTNETAINITDYQFPIQLVDYCSLFTKANAGQASTLCGNYDSFVLDGNTCNMGKGTWTLVSGTGTISEINNPKATVTNVGIGNNVFEWTISGIPNCPPTKSQVTILRKPLITKPEIIHTSPYTLKTSLLGDEYKWYKDNQLLSNNLPTLQLTELGSYKVVVKQNNCDSPISDEFILNADALKNFTDFTKVETYPNPTNGKLTLHITNNQGSEVNIQLYSSAGIFIHSKKIDASKEIDCKITLDMSGLAQGVYFAKITTEKGLQVIQKIILNKE